MIDKNTMDTRTERFKKKKNELPYILLSLKQMQNK